MAHDHNKDMKLITFGIKKPLRGVTTAATSFVLSAQELPFYNQTCFTQNNDLIGKISLAITFSLGYYDSKKKTIILYSTVTALSRISINFSHR